MNFRRCFRVFVLAVVLHVSAVGNLFEVCLGVLNRFG